MESSSTPSDRHESAGREAEAPEASNGAATTSTKPLPALPDYATRGERPPTKPEDARGWEERPGTEPEDVYLFLPRVILFPPNLVLKLAALPIRGLAIAIDRYHLIEHTVDLLYNDERTAAVIPGASYQSGYGLSFGGKAFHNDVFGNGEEASISAKYGGLYRQAYRLAFDGDQIAHTPLWIETETDYEAKPALLFFGLGNESKSDSGANLAAREAAVATRFREDRWVARLTVGTSIGEFDDRSKFGLAGLFNRRHFGGEIRNFPEPSIETVYDTSTIPGFDDGSNVLEVGPVFVYDSRDTEATTSSGVYLDTFGGHTVPVRGGADFWHYGALFATFVDLYHRSRALSFRALIEGVYGTDEDIPFADLPRLGGPVRLRGYQLDRFRDKIATLGTIEYRYPVHDMVSGELFFEAGRVGSGYQEIFGRDGLADFHYGGGLGFAFHNRDKLYFKAEVAYGEELLFFLSTDPLRVFRTRHQRL